VSSFASIVAHSKGGYVMHTKARIFFLPGKDPMVILFLAAWLEAYDRMPPVTIPFLLQRMTAEALLRPGQFLLDSLN